MKKLLFTALVVVAFSGVSFGNSLFKIGTPNKNEEKKIVLYVDCYRWAANYLDRADPNNRLSGTAANKIYQKAYLTCATAPAEPIREAEAIDRGDIYIRAEGGLIP